MEIMRGRKGGKTTKIAEWVKAKPNRLMLVSTKLELERVRREHGVPRKQLRIPGSFLLKVKRLVANLPTTDPDSTDDSAK